MFWGPHQHPHSLLPPFGAPSPIKPSPLPLPEQSMVPTSLRTSNQIAIKSSRRHIKSSAL